MTTAIGVFGGTFDPIHQGHLQAVTQAAEVLGLSRVHWVLSARPPHKNSVSASIADRYAMLQLALADLPKFVIDDREIRRAEKSYTVDTVASFSAEYPDERLVVIIGADSLAGLPSWYQYETLVEQVSWVALQRPGYTINVPDELQARVVEKPAELLQRAPGHIWIYQDSNIDISSTEIRTTLSEGREELAQEYLPSSVLNYIRTKQLYKIPDMNPEQIKDQVVDALENVKGQDIKVIDIAEISDFADFMIVVSGTSDTHVKALAREASDTLRKQGVKPLNEDGADVGEWVLVDFGDVVLHVMRPEVRQYYDLEKLWDEDVRALVKQHRAQEEE